MAQLCASPGTAKNFNDGRKDGHNLEKLFKKILCQTSTSWNVLKKMTEKGVRAVRAKSSILYCHGQLWDKEKFWVSLRSQWDKSPGCHAGVPMCCYRCSHLWRMSVWRQGLPQKGVHPTAVGRWELHLLLEHVPWESLTWERSQWQEQMVYHSPAAWS